MAGRVFRLEYDKYDDILFEDELRGSWDVPLDSSFDTLT